MYNQQLNSKTQYVYKICDIHNLDIIYNLYNIVMGLGTPLKTNMTGWKIPCSIGSIHRLIHGGFSSDRHSSVFGGGGEGVSFQQKHVSHEKKPSHSP